MVDNLVSRSTENRTVEPGCEYPGRDKDSLNWDLMVRGKLLAGPVQLRAIMVWKRDHLIACVWAMHPDRIHYGVAAIKTPPRGILRCFLSSSFYTQVVIDTFKSCPGSVEGLIPIRAGISENKIACPCASRCQAASAQQLW